MSFINGFRRYATTSPIMTGCKIYVSFFQKSAVEGGHKGEELVERQTAKAIRSGIRHHKMKPYKAVEKACLLYTSKQHDHG